MRFRRELALALKQARKAYQLTQEDFFEVSSRTYLSNLERGQKSPTLSKLADISSVIGIHPLTLLTLATLHSNEDVELDPLFEKIKKEVEFVCQKTS